MDLELRGSVAVVTGGASGIGRAVAEGFLGEGARVALWDRAADVGAVAAELAGRFGRDVLGLTVDVADAHSVSEAVSQTEARLGLVEHLVHGAAVGSGKFGVPFLNVPPEDWRRVLEVNVLGMAYVAHAVAPGMIERRGGTLVFVGSVAGQIGSPTDPPYSASKAAGINFAQCLARDLAPHEVRVNTVCPGMVDTPLSRRIWQAWHDRQPPESRQSYDDWTAEKLRAMVPLGRWQNPADIADMVLFLSSERARQVTGQTINVDGGYVMHW